MGRKINGLSLLAAPRMAENIRLTPTPGGFCNLTNLVVGDQVEAFLSFGPRFLIPDKGDVPDVFSGFGELNMQVERHLPGGVSNQVFLELLHTQIKGKGNLFAAKEPSFLEMAIRRAIHTAHRWLADVVPYLPSGEGTTFLENNMDSLPLTNPGGDTTNVSTNGAIQNVANTITNEETNGAVNGNTKDGATGRNMDNINGRTIDVLRTHGGHVDAGHPSGVINSNNVVFPGNADTIGSALDRSLAAIFVDDGGHTIEFNNDVNVDDRDVCHVGGVLHVLESGDENPVRLEELDNNVLESGNDNSVRLEHPDGDTDVNIPIRSASLDAVFTDDFGDVGDIFTNAVGMRSSTPLNDSDVLSVSNFRKCDDLSLALNFTRLSPVRVPLTDSDLCINQPSTDWVLEPGQQFSMGEVNAELYGEPTPDISQFLNVRGQTINVTSPIVLPASIVEGRSPGETIVSRTNLTNHFCVRLRRIEVSSSSPAKRLKNE